MESSAVFSPCRRYRYALWRRWGDLLEPGRDGYAMFICLNPSTADETRDDPTIRRCIAFARAWGYSGLCMANLFAFRATDPAKMMAQANPIGPENDEHLSRLAKGALVVVAAWGANGTHLGRDVEVRRALPALHYLSLTKEGHPGHPLYLPKSLTPVAWGVSVATDETGSQV
ncbi:MAG: hypothetical protein BroJett038_23770 [Chloroflexota bacterium]|nr:MAG: hypothetical protein BroJett038_23770 [Chloroflexota bacterium]